MSVLEIPRGADKPLQLSRESAIAASEAHASASTGGFFMTSPIADASLLIDGVEHYLWMGRACMVLRSAHEAGQIAEFLGLEIRSADA